MTEYTPPNTFFSQTYGLFENQDMYKFIGKNGAHFKFLTTKLGLDYIWWKKETNIIELWGPHTKLSFAKKVMEEKLKKFMENKPLTTRLQRCCAVTHDEVKEIKKFVDALISQ